jgi:hypothetical protein
MSRCSGESRPSSWSPTDREENRVFGRHGSQVLDREQTGIAAFFGQLAKREVLSVGSIVRPEAIEVALVEVLMTPGE